MFLNALRLQYESEIAKAKDNIEVYLTNPAGIGEHPDLAAAIDSQVILLANAEDKLEVLMKHFGNEVVQMKKKIHANTHIIRSNQKTGERNPVITVKTYKTNTYAHEVEILGNSKVVYSPDDPLPCGARLWIETDAEVIVDGKTLEL